jgi:malic enzyme
VPGLGNSGASAGKPVMEGKGNRFKQGADTQDIVNMAAVAVIDAQGRTR